jgi:hypothetical protein
MKATKRTTNWPDAGIPVRATKFRPMENKVEELDDQDDPLTDALNAIDESQKSKAKSSKTKSRKLKNKSLKPRA